MPLDDEASDGDIAIIGIGCRLPGECSSPVQFWHKLTDGFDAVTEMPDQRIALLAERYGRNQVSQRTRGGYLNDIDKFDADFFGIAPREARLIDPQHRILLEIAYESLEDAGLSPNRLRGTDIGVFVGIFLDEYWDMQRYTGSDVTAHTNIGGTMSIAANRISYTFDFRGPSMSIDTACSSSLVAVHLACQSIRTGESTVALAGGVNLLLSPQTTAGFQQASMISEIGRCSPFDASADGYVRSDGAGIIVLKHLPAARADKDHIYAIIKGSVVNQDGRTPGITVPSAQAQKKMLTDVYGHAGIATSSVRFVEAHGPGTPVGDPVEAQALGEVLGPGREPGAACLVGSVKSNIGHAEAASGVAGLIKAALAIHHRYLPRSIHCGSPNPQIPFAKLGLRICTENESLSGSREEIVAGVNSFGFGGVNAHIVLQGVAEELSPESLPLLSGLVPLCAQHPASLRDLGAAMAGNAYSERVPNVNLAVSAVSRYRSHRYRAAVVFDPEDDLFPKFEALAAGRSHPDLIDGMVRPSAKLAFVFTGMGPQWWGMGRGLYEREKVYRETIDRCDTILNGLADWSLIDELLMDESESRIHETRIAQPANFALQVALADLWISRGVVPDCVVGHSVGEIAAAVVAGFLTLEEGLKICSLRGALQEEVAGHGTMMAVGISLAEAQVAISHLDDSVSIAAVNSPVSVTLSGNSDALHSLAAGFDQETIFNRRLDVDVAYHGNHLDPLRDRFIAGLIDLAPGAGSCPMISSVNGRFVQDGQLDAEYWWYNMRRPVRLDLAMDKLCADSGLVFLEVGPHPVLSQAITENLSHHAQSGVVLASLRRDEPDHRTHLKTLGSLYTLGIDVDLLSLYPGFHPHVPLPTYPWRKKSYWLPSLAMRDHDSKGHGDSGLAMRHMVAAGPGKCHLLETTLNPANQTFLSDHRIRGKVVIAAAVYIEIIFRCLEVLDWDASVGLLNLEILNPCLIEDDEPRICQTMLNVDSNVIGVEISIRRSGQDSSWTRHVVAAIGPVKGQVGFPIMNKLPETAVAVSGEQYYENLRKRGMAYGLSFRKIERARHTDIHSQAVLVNQSSEHPFLMDPALIDAGFQALSLSASLDSRLWLPTAVAELDRGQILQSPGDPLVVNTTITERQPGSVHGEFSISDANGVILLSVRGAVLQPLGQIEASMPLKYLKEHWLPSSLPKSLVFNHSSVLLIQDQELSENGEVPPCKTLIRVRSGSHFERVGTDEFEIDLDCDDDYARLFKEVSRDEAVPVWHIVLQVSSSATFNGTSPPADFEQVYRSGAFRILRIVQAVAASASKTEFRIWVATNRACSVIEDETINVAQTILPGMLRVLVNEHMELSPTWIDLDEFSLSTIVQELQGAQADLEIAYRNGKRYTRSLMGIKKPDRRRTSDLAALAATEGIPWRLSMASPGLLDDLACFGVPRPVPGSREVEIQIEASGLNFRDAMTALGLLPTLDLDGLPAFGWECAGRVTAVGPGVRHVQEGETVIAIAPGTLGSHAIAQASLVFPLPGALSVIQGAGIPVVFLTAWYGLIHQARIRPGEKVLIHSASGGVGLASIQIARHVGAEILATAGSEMKRQFLRDEGIQHVMDSRSLGFADEIRAVTDGRGVDVVLNSLAGEAFEESLGLVAADGRFVELGKSDIQSNRAISLGVFDRGISFISIDLARRWRETPLTVGENLAECLALFDEGELSPIPTTEFAFQDAQRAFHHMTEPDHIGKIVLSANESPINVQPAPGFVGRPERSVLISGAFGALGRLLTEWFYDNGTRHLVLVGHHEPDALSSSLIDRLRLEGMRIDLAVIDITDRDALSRVIVDASQSPNPLGGVVHAAGVLDDGLVINQTPDRLRRVLAPKVEGGWHLHELTEHLDLDFFVLFSSISAVTGTIGQAGYAASNSFLDGLARFRRSKGLPGLSIDWAKWEDTGMAPVSSSTEIATLYPEQALVALGLLLDSCEVQIAVLQNSMAMGARLFSEQKDDHHQSWSADFGNMSEVQRVAEIGQYLGTLAARVTEADGGDFALPASWIELGLDSLMAVEMHNQIQKDFQADIPVSDFQRNVLIEQTVYGIMKSFG